MTDDRSTVDLPDDRVTKSFITMILEAYPDFSLTSHTDLDGNRYLP